MSTPLALGDRRLVVVTGKGGVGKSTVAAALARSAASAGRRVLAIDVEGSGVARALGCATPSAEPVSLGRGLAVAVVDARSVLAGVVHDLMPLGILARRLLESTTFQLVAAAAPGLPEYLVLTRIAEWLDATRLGRPRWDLLVVDAPASGHAIPLLTAPRTLGPLTRIGPAARPLARIDAVLADATASALWIVTLPEELPVRETIELYDALARTAGLPVHPPIVNAMPRRRFTAADARALDAADAGHPMIEGARFELARRRAALAQVATLRRALGSRPVALPYEPGDPDAEGFVALRRAIGRATGLAA